MLVHNTTKLESCVDLAGTTVAKTYSKIESWQQMFCNVGPADPVTKNARLATSLAMYALPESRPVLVLLIVFI